MKKWFTSLLLFLGMILTPLFAEAHVKWFTNLTPAKVPLEKILSPLFMVISVGVAVLLALLTQVLPIIMKWKPLEKQTIFLRVFVNIHVIY